MLPWVFRRVVGEGLVRCGLVVDGDVAGLADVRVVVAEGQLDLVACCRRIEAVEVRVGQVGQWSRWFGARPLLGRCVGRGRRVVGVAGGSPMTVVAGNVGRPKTGEVKSKAPVRSP